MPWKDLPEFFILVHAGERSPANGGPPEADKISNRLRRLSRQSPAFSGTTADANSFSNHEFQMNHDNILSYAET